jgi:hypothetical protein
LFEKLEEKNLKDIIRQLTMLAFSQEQIIKKLHIENEEMKKHIDIKDKKINELDNQLKGIKSNLMGSKFTFTFIYIYSYYK